MNKEEVYTVLALIISLIAIFQTRKQLRISKKENLFEKRINALFICQKLLSFYEQNEFLFKKEILRFEDIEKIHKFIEIHFEIKEANEIKDLRKTVEKLVFIFEGSYVLQLQNFFYILIFLMEQIFYTKSFLEKIDHVKGMEEKELVTLKEYFINNTFLTSWLKGKEDAGVSYKYIKKKNILKKLKKQTKF